MPDNTFRIEAIVDTEQMAKLAAAGNLTKETMAGWEAEWREASTVTATALDKISEDTKATALTVGEDWKTLTRASLAYRSAVNEVTAATRLARKAGEDDAAAVALLAAAKQKAAEASLELRAAEAATVAETEVESLSMKELAASTAEAFSLLSESFLEVGIGAAMFGHLTNEAADFSVQMHNLSLTSGISARTLAGLHDLVKEMGGDFDSVAMGLSKMLKAQQEAVNGATKQVDGFRMVGVSVNELKSLNPEELFFRLAQGFQNAGSSAEKNTAAIDIFGRGGRALIPVFESAGAQFRSMVEEEAKASGVTEQSIQDSLKWKEQTEELSVSMRGFATDVLPYLVKGMGAVAAGSVAIGAVIDTVFVAIRASIISTIEGIEGLGRVLKDVATGNFTSIVSDAKTAKGQITDTWQDGARQIQFAWRAVGEEYNKIVGAEKIPSIAKASGEDLPGPASEKKDKDRSDRFIEAEQRMAAERERIARRMAEISVEENDFFQRSQEKRAEEAGAAELRQIVEASQERVKLHELDIDQARDAGVAKVEIERQNVQTEFNLHRISGAQRLALLRQLENDEYAIEKTALEKKEAAARLQQNPAIKVKELQNQIEKLTGEHEHKLAKLRTEGVKESEHGFDQYFAHFNSGFQSAFNGVLTGTKTFARGMAELFSSLTLEIIDSIAQIGLKWIEQHLLMRAFSAIFHTQEVAEDAAAQAAKIAVHSAGNVVEATSDAGLAAAGTFAWWSAVNPIIAPAMAAVAYAEGLGFAAASAAGGAFLSQDMPLFAHKNEMVLPAPLSLGFKDIIGRLSGGGEAQASGSGGRRGGSGSSLTHNYYGDINMSAFDGKGVADMIHRNRDAFTRFASGMVRNGWRPR